MTTSLFSLAFGVGTQNRQGAWLEVFYAQPLLKPSAELVAAVLPLLDYTGGNQAIAINKDKAADLAAALAAAPAAKSFFDGLSNSLQRYHVGQVTDAKTDATRDRRIAKAVQLFLDGKQR